MPVEKLEDPEGLRDAPGGEFTATAVADEARRCAEARANAILLEQGAEARAALYTPSVIANLSIGTVGFMLAQILNGDVPVRDAKQAIEVAKIALVISDKVTDEANLAHGTTGVTSPQDRAERIARKDELTELLRQRAKDLLEKHGADAAPAAGFDPSEWDLDDDNPPQTYLRAVPSPPGPRAKVS